jgi:hypothetical protein
VGAHVTDGGESTVARALAARLATAQRALTVALSAVVEVNAEFAELLATPHLTTPCYIGAHEACQLRCSCSDCREPCECTCHTPASGLRA